MIQHGDTVFFQKCDRCGRTIGFRAPPHWENCLDYNSRLEAEVAQLAEHKRLLMGRNDALREEIDDLKQETDRQTKRAGAAVVAYESAVKQWREWRERAEKAEVRIDQVMDEWDETITEKDEWKERAEKAEEWLSGGDRNCTIGDRITYLTDRIARLEEAVEQLLLARRCSWLGDKWIMVQRIFDQAQAVLRAEVEP